jgi:molecular chaperone IbpA
MNAMTRFDTAALNRALVGFDRMFDTFEHRFANQIQNNYPPHNVLRVDENNYAIEVAVAGFQKTEINVKVDQDQLVITGESQRDEDASITYLHRGLSSRDFTKAFTLADHIFVKGAVIKDGILRVDLERQVPEALKPRLIDIVEV